MGVLTFVGVALLQLLEERIRRDGIIRDGDVLKVDSFLNHQMDVAFFAEMAKEWARIFDGCGEAYYQYP